MIIAGVVYSCDVFQREGSFTAEDLFAGFGRKSAIQIILALIIFGFGAMLTAIVNFLLGSDATSKILAEPQSLFSSISSLATTSGIPEIMLAGMIFTAGMAICAMTLWFAPALVMLQSLSLVKAIRMSLYASYKNILPGIIVFTVMIVLMLFSSISRISDLLVSIPIFFMFLCIYTSYRDIFFDQKN